MTLKEKFETKSSIDTTKEAKVFARECEQIADDYAIEFLDWVDNNGLEVLWNRGINKPKELLKIFKKEKGL